MILSDPKTDCVLALSEVGFDAHYFNEEAWKTLLAGLQRNPWINHILIDGALTRLDRPEILNDLLTYWARSRIECRRATKRIPNRQQYRWMQGVQLDILKKRLGELRAAAPAAKITLSTDSDDTQFSLSARLAELLILRQEKIGESIKEHKGKWKGLIADRKKSEKSLVELRKADKQSEARGVARKIGELKSQIKQAEGLIKRQMQELKFFRGKKARPLHQRVTVLLVRALRRAFESICAEYQVACIHQQKVLKIGCINVDWAHSRHSTWAPMLAMDTRLVASTHGQLTTEELHFRETNDQLMKRAAETGIDMILESGHHGLGFKQLQKRVVHPDETNFKNMMRYHPTMGEKHVTVLCLLPFEDQEGIERFLKGDEPERMSGGKPTNTRNHAVFNRYKNNGVSGITLFWKHPSWPTGMVGTRDIQYQDFLDGSALREVEQYAAIAVSSDEHIGSREAMPIVQDGLTELYRRHSREPFSFCGRPAYLRGFISGGDTAEANSQKWTFRGYDERNPRKLRQELARLLINLNQTDPVAVSELANQWVSDSMGGPVESMGVIMKWVADYLEGFLETTLRESILKHAHVSVPGNHADDVLRGQGLKETDIFAERCRARGIGVYEVGEADRFKSDPWKDVRVVLGGHSIARVVHVPDYGMDINGQALFGPLSLVVHHDPKGGGYSGIVGTGKSAQADVIISGHIHVNYKKLYKVANNRFRVAYRCAALQGVDPVAIYLAGSVPRTSAAHLLVMPKPGDFGELTIPAHLLRDIGAQVHHDRAVQEIKEKKNQEGEGQAPAEKSGA